MGISKIEQLIEDIYEFVESCKMQPLSSTKVIVPKDELYDLLDELRLRTPDEIKRYQKIIANRDAILEEAQKKANNMLAEAEAQTNALIDEHQIMQQAYWQAEEIVNDAGEQANQMLAQAKSDSEQIRMGALDYTNNLLVQTESIVEQTLNTSRNQFENIVQVLQQNLDVIEMNKKELFADNEKEVAVAESNSVQDDSSNDFEFDDNTFLDDINKQ